MISSKQVVPVNGSREALFAFAQAVIDSSKPNPVVISPNPFYQIYEDAALLAGPAVFHQHHGANGFSQTGMACRKKSGNARNWCTSAAPATRPVRCR